MIGEDGAVSVVELHLVEDRYGPIALETLLRRVSERYAEVVALPLPHVRAFVTLHAPELFAVGGVSAAVDGDAAPYFVATVLEGRPVATRQRLLGALTDVVVDVLGATRSRVRGRVVEVAPTDWAVGGVPAVAGRREEIVARSPML